MSIDLDHIRQVFDEADCLFTREQVDSAIEHMAADISETLAEKNPLVFAVMNGGLVFAGKLLTHLHFPLESSYMHATRYRNTTRGGELDWKVPPAQDLKDRHVLIVDDILDEGHTLSAIVEHCKAAGAAEVLTAVLVDKKHDRKAHPGQKCDFTGLICEDRYIFGSGMDYQGYWRNAPGIYALKGH
ncbi:hypoxanthine-guanine phosphoribosyltransferase [Parendozoicomonas haliclonae]|uniref:Hypoxanthine-guanine phosphoribosyltransferase n=1 Tax=Parendozoicomonas haliclonae TaxID=1960125 RepID=A0A1X7AEW8_9GAMM|nr:hypoxanthine-guanine phosphoribosyltransferase [Parendozoicomonas haliclonae]SMA34544.1 Hypoxanthine-guanine phosphoribosyltransferase [Parendozoicomonas haliclonae]